MLSSLSVYKKVHLFCPQALENVVSTCVLVPSNIIAVLPPLHSGYLYSHVVYWSLSISVFAAIYTWLTVQKVLLTDNNYDSCSIYRPYIMNIQGCYNL
jgi:hypothetical protein